MRQRGGPGYGRLFREPAYTRVFGAGLGSVTGAAITAVCLVWVTYESTGSALDVAALGTAWIVAAMGFSLIGGAWVDRYDRRRLMIAADFARAAAVGALALELSLFRFSLAPAVAAYAVVGACTAIFGPAEQALVPALLPADLVADGNGLVRSSRNVLQFVGTAIGGALIATVGARVGIAANAGTYLLSGLLLLGMRVPAHPRAPSPARPGMLQEIRAGVRWLVGAKGFFQLTLSATFFNFCAILVTAFLVVYATGVLHGSAIVYAALLASEVAGSAVGALLVGRTGAVRWAGRAWVVPNGVVSAGVVLALVFFPSVPVALAALFALGALSGFAVTAWLTAAQLLVPTEMQGRYFGVDGLGSVAILPAAQIGGAFLIEAYGVRATYLAAALVWLVAGAAFLAPRALWNLGVRGPSPRSDADAAGTSGSPEGSRGA